MAETHDKIPSQSEVVDNKGFISRAWHQFLYKIFGDIETRLQALETAKDDHETRIETLEGYHP